MFLLLPSKILLSNTHLEYTQVSCISFFNAKTLKSSALYLVINIQRYKVRTQKLIKETAFCKKNTQKTSTSTARTLVSTPIEAVRQYPHHNSCVRLSLLPSKDSRLSTQLLKKNYFSHHRYCYPKFMCSIIQNQDS